MTRSNNKQYTGEASHTASQVMILANQAREGNKTAFAQLIDLFHEDIYRMVYYRTGNRMDAEDITQEIFLNAFKSLSKLKNVERFRAWIFRIGLNRVRDFYRKKKFSQYSKFTLRVMRLKRLIQHSTISLRPWKIL